MLDLIDTTKSFPLGWHAYCVLSERRTKNWDCPTLPALLGEIQIADKGITFHSPDASKFNPLAFIANERPEPQRDVLPMPISLLPDSSFIPKEYHVHICEQSCSCGHKTKWVRVYAFNDITSRLGSGKPIKNLVPVETFKYNVPVKLFRAKDKAVPACIECLGSQDLSHLPRPMDTEEYKRVVSVFQNPGNTIVPQTEKPKVAASATKGPAKTPKQPVTLDDIL